MDDLTKTALLIAASGAVVGGFAGYVIGLQRAKRDRQELRKAFNDQSLTMLDIKAKSNKLAKTVGQAERKDRLLQLTMKRLKLANDNNAALAKQLTTIEKKHFIALSRVRLVVAQATTKTKHAEAVAKRATNHLQRLEQAGVGTQTINAPPAKSYGAAAAVPVKVVDQQAPDAQKDAVKRVSNRDSIRFTGLQSSNEGVRHQPDNLQAIDGIDRKVERQLNRVGIHRVEQLANMSDADLEALAATLNTPNGKDYKSAWKGGAQSLLRQQ